MEQKLEILLSFEYEMVQDDMADVHECSQPAGANSFKDMHGHEASALGGKLSNSPHTCLECLNGDRMRLR